MPTEKSLLLFREALINLCSSLQGGIASYLSEYARVQMKEICQCFEGVFGNDKEAPHFRKRASAVLAAVLVDQRRIVYYRDPNVLQLARETQMVARADDLIAQGKLQISPQTKAQIITIDETVGSHIRRLTQLLEQAIDPVERKRVQEMSRMAQRHYAPIRPKELAGLSKHLEQSDMKGDK